MATVVGPSNVGLQDVEVTIPQWFFNLSSSVCFCVCVECVFVFVCKHDAWGLCFRYVPILGLFTSLLDVAFSSLTPSYTVHYSSLP